MNAKEGEAADAKATHNTTRRMYGETKAACTIHPGLRDDRWRARGRAGPWETTEYSRDLGRRHRLVQPEHLPPGRHGVLDPEHRPDRQGRGDVHELVRPAELHRRPGRVHHGSVADPDWPHQGRPAG